MAITKNKIAQLVALITNMPAPLVEEKMSDAQAQALALNIGEILSPNEVFQPADIARFVGNEGSIYNADEAKVYAATLTPAQIFTGAPGLAKLEAWATEAGWTHT